MSYTIVTPDGETEEFITDLLDADFEGIDQGTGTYDWSYNKQLPLMASPNETQRVYTSN